MSNDYGATTTDEQLWAAFQSVYEPGSRLDFEPDERPEWIDALRAVAVFAVSMSAEHLVRKDQFSERTLRLLDSLEARINDGEYITDLTVAVEETLTEPRDVPSA